jgi:DNA-binding LacI/PurR family transcriptional regulator
MRQPMHEMGLLAMTKLMSRIKDPAAPPTLTTFLPDLIIRDSCGARKQELALTGGAQIPLVHIPTA